METSQDVGATLGGRIRARYGATILVGSSLLALLLVGGAFCVWAWGPDDLDQKLEQVQEGMTESEIEAILGKHDFIGGCSFDGNMRTWTTGRSTAWIFFDLNGKAGDKFVFRTPLWDRIRAKLPW